MMVGVLCARNSGILKKASQIITTYSSQAFKEPSNIATRAWRKSHVLTSRLQRVITESHNQRNYSERGKPTQCPSPPPCLRDELICQVVEPVIDGHNKVTVVGAGMVGVACANAILFQKISSHVAILDVFPKKLQGEGLDFCHSMSFLDDARVEYDTDFCITSNSKVVIITIGARQNKGETRLDLVNKNAEIMKNIIVPLTEYSPRAVFIMVSNPVDIMSLMAWKIGGLPLNRIIGSGCHLDSARFRYHIAQRLAIAPSSVKGWIVGEHGESQVPLWSGVNVAGTTLRNILPNIGLPTDEEKWMDVASETVADGAQVRCLKGYSNTAIGLSVADIAKAVLHNTQQVKSVSTLVQGHHGVSDELFLSLPCTIGENGISNIIRLRMTDLERKQFQYSASQVLKSQKSLNL